MKRLFKFFRPRLIIFPPAIVLLVLWLTQSEMTIAENVRRRAGFQGYSVQDRVRRYGEAARTQLKPFFEKASVSYPPKKLLLLGLKKEETLELYAEDASKQYRFIRSYPILRASGSLGPKLQQGDGQVPEGIYKIELLNPNSQFHLSLRVNYPNQFDRKKAAIDRRTNLGGDIMIHGSMVSIGCLAMGDAAIEEIFVLAADTGLPNIDVILSPLDFRNSSVPEKLYKTLRPWVPELYELIRTRVLALPKPL